MDFPMSLNKPDILIKDRRPYFETFRISSDPYEKFHNPFLYPPSIKIPFFLEQEIEVSDSRLYLPDLRSS